MIQKDWGVLVSQTGSEVASLSEKLGFFPSLLVTNNINKIPSKNLRILIKIGVNIQTLPFRPTVQDYINSGIVEKPLVTLHGFLRILPESLFEYFKGRAYNGHPALITLYPELKGFNKQEDIAGNQEKYPLCGSVVHEVIPELDSGKIVTSACVQNTAKTVDEAYSLLRNTSLISWIDFFENVWEFEKK